MRVELVKEKKKMTSDKMSKQKLISVPYYCEQ